MREIESLETFPRSKWDGNNEDAGSLWGGGGNGSGLEMWWFQGFSVKQHPSPTPSRLELSIFCRVWVFAGEGGWVPDLTHLFTLYEWQEVEMRPDKGPYQNGAGSLAFGRSGSWVWPSLCVLEWIRLPSLSSGYCICEWGLNGCLPGTL